MIVSAMRTNVNVIPNIPAKPPTYQNQYQRPNNIIIHQETAQIPPNNQERDNQILISTFQRLLPPKFSFVKFLGKGSFGHVIKCYNYEKRDYYAIKFLNTGKSVTQIVTEIDTLYFINQNDPENMFVKFIEHFNVPNFHCVVFELLGENLYEYLKRHNFVGMTIEQSLNIAFQLGQAFYKLATLNVIHCDVKPENIAIVKHSSEMIKIKVIDFGSSCYVGKTIFKYIQSRFYRAPEVILELPYDNMIDIWSVGCVIVETITGNALFPGVNENDQIAYFYQYLGPPPSNVVATSPRINVFYEFRNNNFMIKNDKPGFNIRKYIGDVVMNSYSAKNYLYGSRDIDSRRQTLTMFVDLINSILVYDPKIRISPDQIIYHPIFNSHRSTTANSHQMYSTTTNVRLKYSPNHIIPQPPPLQLTQPPPPQAFAVYTPVSSIYVNLMPPQPENIIHNMNSQYIQFPQQPVLIGYPTFPINMPYASHQPEVIQYTPNINYQLPNQNIQTHHNTCRCNQCIYYYGSSNGYIQKGNPKCDRLLY